MGRSFSSGAEPPSPDDGELVERVRGGDATAFDQLVERHMWRAYAVAYRLLGHREDAEDLVQDAFLVALAKLDTFHSGRSFGPWFYRIVVNRGLNQRKARSRRRTEPLPDEAPARQASPERLAEQSELRARLSQALDELPETQRAVVQLFEVEGFTGAEIAEIMEIPAGTVRWHLHQAKKTLREILEPLRRRET